MKFKKKPVIIEAMQLTVNNFNDVLRWCGGVSHTPEKLNDVAIDIETLEGVMRAHIGDWIIEGVNGEFYPCKNDVFWQSYEEAK